MFPANGPTYSICEAAGWRCSTEEERQQALVAVDYSLRPAGEDDLGAALYTLRIMTRGRERYEADDREAEAIVWLQQLRKYPADIALDVIRNWPSRSDGQWWPTWHDVLKELEGQTGTRRMLAENIRSGACLAKPTVDLDRDDSPEAIAHRQAVVERHKGKLSGGLKADAPTSPAEDFDAWQERTLSEIRVESTKGRYRLSEEALSAAGLTIPTPKTERSAA